MSDKPILLKQQNFINKSFQLPINSVRPQRQFDVLTIKGLNIEQRAKTGHSAQVAEVEEELAAFYPQSITWKILNH